MGGLPEYDRFDGLGLAQLVRSGCVSPRELVDEALTRLARAQPRLNAFAAVFEPRVRREIAAGLPDGPFHGVPFALKDLFMQYRGEATGNGSRFWRGAVAAHDSELFARYRRAGFAIVGKTATPELGMAATTETRAFGATRNPWDLGRTPGGSSGGAAAAVAAGIVPLAHASDSGGSIRIPASCCGLFGLKPSRGRMPMGPERGESSGGFGTAHAVTRSVRDSAALLDATAGSDLGAPYGIAPPTRPWLDEVNAPTGRLRIAIWSPEPDGVTLHSDCRAALRDAGKLCQDLGHVVDEAAPAIDLAALEAAGAPVLAASTRVLIDDRTAEIGRPPAADELEPTTHRLYELSGSLTAADYSRGIGASQRAGRTLAGFMRDWDVLLMPTLAQPPVPIGTIRQDDPDFASFRAASRAFNPYSALANRTGVPAATVPLHWSAAGLPIGVQFVARFGEEATLIRLASQLESARPWFHRRPPAAG